MLINKLPLSCCGSTNYLCLVNLSKSKQNKTKKQKTKQNKKQTNKQTKKKTKKTKQNKPRKNPAFEPALEPAQQTTFILLWINKLPLSCKSK